MQQQFKRSFHGGTVYAVEPGKKCRMIHCCGSISLPIALPTWIALDAIVVFLAWPKVRIEVLTNNGKKIHPQVVFEVLSRKSTHRNASKKNSSSKWALWVENTYVRSRSWRLNRICCALVKIFQAGACADLSSVQWPTKIETHNRLGKSAIRYTVWAMAVDSKFIVLMYTRLPM